MFGSLHCQKKKKKLALSRVLCDLYHGCAYMLQIKDKSCIQLVDCSQAAFFVVVASPGYRAVGIVVIRTMEIVSGDVIMKLDNDFFPKAIHHQLLPCLPKNLIKSISCQHLQNILCIFLKRSGCLVRNGLADCVLRYVRVVILESYQPLVNASFSVVCWR